MPLKSMLIRLDKDFHRNLKTHCARHGKSMQEFVMEAINKQLDKQDKAV